MFNTGLYPYTISRSTGILSAIKNIKWGTLLSNTQKTLGVINQAIQVVYQIKPIWNNAKTMFNIIGAIKDDNKKTNYTQNKNNITQTQQIVQNETSTNQITYKQSNQPQFFL